MNIETLYQYRDLLAAVCRDTPHNTGRDINIMAPEVRIMGPKTNFINFTKVCVCFDRDCSHLKQYIDLELSTTSSTNIDGVLIIHGKFRTGGIQKVLLKYITEYVQCVSCQSIKTTLIKEDKLSFINCCDCHSTKYVTFSKKV